MADIRRAAETPVGAATASLLLGPVGVPADDAVIVKDLDGIVTSWNQAAELLFGFTAGEMIGQPISRLMPPHRAGEAPAILSRARSGEQLSHFETERLHKSGRIIPVSLTISPIRDAAGEIAAISKVVRDLSELQRLNAELLRREALLQSIIGTVPDALVVIDQRGTVQSFSPAAERMFGYAAGEIVGCNVSVLMPEPHRSGHDLYLGRYQATGDRHIIGIGRITVARRKDGGTFPIELQIGEVLVPGAHLFTGFIRDLTERNERDRRLAELQSELIHVSRLSELGQMVSALAHEVNQPLTAIANYASGLRRLATDDASQAQRQAIERIGEQAERARGIVRSLRTLVKKDSQDAEVVDVAQMIQETSALALVGASRSVDLDLRIAEDASHAFVDRVQIQQVLLNLMRNAVEAMAGMETRRLIVRTARREDRVEASVCDTGPGLPVLVRARLFQPFVTTKPEGLGVGLSICRTIVEAHGGELTAEDRPEGGACFRFSVLRAEPSGDKFVRFQGTDLDQ